MSHGNAKTYPKLAQPMGFCPPEQVSAVAEAIVTTQRDYGDRSERRHARLKYTIDDHGLNRRNPGNFARNSLQDIGNGSRFIQGWKLDDEFHYGSPTFRKCPEPLRSV